MKLLHTSDWHLGRTLYGRKRYAEFEAFLDWLLEAIEQEHIEVLLIAGDIFDTTTPSNRAQELYFNFLCRVSASSCRHVVVIGGNHDSPSFLAAPAQLLRALHIYVVAAATDSPADEVVVLTTAEGEPEAIVCAVPYLRDRDVRSVDVEESIDEKAEKLIAGVADHYYRVSALAQQQLERTPTLPVIVMGHLFTAGGTTTDGDGVRELYVGSLAHVGVEIFPEWADYVALGHLHSAQQLGNAEHIRYSGSPLPMGFGEAQQRKSVVIAEFTPEGRLLRELPIPQFQELLRLSGTLAVLIDALRTLKEQQSCAWLEIEYTGEAIVGDLSAVLADTVAGTSLEIRRVLNRRAIAAVTESLDDGITLDDVDVYDVFNRCCEQRGVAPEERGELTALFAEIVQAHGEEDRNEA